MYIEYGLDTQRGRLTQCVLHIVFDCYCSIIFSCRSQAKSLSADRTAMPQGKAYDISASMILVLKKQQRGEGKRNINLNQYQEQLFLALDLHRYM